MSVKPIYNKKEWVLAICGECHKENYVEPHGITAQCSRCNSWTAHESVPHESITKTLRGDLVNMSDLRSRFPLIPLHENQLKENAMSVNKHAIQLQDTEVSTWFERDRAHVHLHIKGDPGKTLMEWWDDGVGEDVEAGYLNPKDWHKSAYGTWAERCEDDPFLIPEEEEMMEYMERQFMEPSFYFGEYIEVENEQREGSIFPAKYYEPEEGDKEESRGEGWLCRLSAPGYMDCTEWDGPFSSEVQAARHLIDVYGDWDGLEAENDGGDE